jgi:hypothetical protein
MKNARMGDPEDHHQSEAERRDALLRRLLNASGWQLTREVVEAARLRHLARVSEGITTEAFGTLNELAIEPMKTCSDRIIDEAIEAWEPAVEKEAAFA